MSFGNIIIIIFILTYVNYIMSFLDTDKIKEIKNNNIKMDNLRKIPLKTIEQQKEFINTRYPKKEKFKFKLMTILEAIPMIVMYGGIYMLLDYIFEITQINIQIWQAVSVIIVFPILINLIFKKFGLQKPDILIFFK